jgi:tetratricopeptide (TPR) repeat protein
MRWIVAVALLGIQASGAEPRFELAGQIVPKRVVPVTLYGVGRSYKGRTLADFSGRFKFKKLPAGTYLLSIYLRSRGEARMTVEIGPSLADQKRRVPVTFNLATASFAYRDLMRRRNVVSARQLSIPEAARREFQRAHRDIGKPDIEAAITRLERAVAIAPQFWAAWNDLGSLAAMTRRFDRAEECFRKALNEEPGNFEPRVNLGGVLLSTRKFDEALEHNLYALKIRPNDALANAQAGIAYFQLGRLEQAEERLERARQIDPAHYSYPQLILADIHVKRKLPAKAAEALEDFLRRHPDWPQARRLRETIAKLRSSG